MNQADPPVLETSAGPRTLEEIESALNAAWSLNPHVPDSIRMQIGIATGEIGANIVEHAGQGQPVRVRMKVTVLPNEVWVEFDDDGIPARVDLARVRLPDDMAERGRGLALALSVLEKLSYRRNQANHWTLVSKRFS